MLAPHRGDCVVSPGRKPGVSDEIGRAGRVAAHPYHSIPCDPSPHRSQNDATLASMAHTYNVNYVHCVFSTKRRLPLIPQPEKIWTTLREVARMSKIKVLAVGGTADHVHLLISIPSTRTVSEVVRDLKCNSSLRIRKWNRVFSWQDGYGAMSVSPSAIASVMRYIANQQTYHATRSFEEEYTSILERAGVKFDPEYVFD